ncbi:MAG: acyltransferase [Solirubrobacterales bacterium]|nr:acyltransferase [Solirubrobacterales bacterium]
MSTAADASNHHDATHVTDPGKEYRAGAGIPIVPAMDGFRAFAILGIVFLHVQGVVLIPGSQGLREVLGTVGKDLVSILFVLSGFVVFLPTVARGGKFGDVGAFFIRRGARLLPAYWAALVVTFLLVLSWPDAGFPIPGLGTIAINLGVLQSPAHIFDPGSGFSLFGFGINGPLWTLSLEITFYLLLPVIAVAYARRPLVGLAIAALITIGWHVAFNNLADVADLFGFHPSPEKVAEVRAASINQFPSFAFHFACGMTGAWAYVRLRHARAPGELEVLGARLQQVALVSLLAFAGLLGYIAATTDLVLAEYAPFNEILILAYTVSLAAFMVGTSLASRPRQVPFALPVARRAGDMSYGIYLIHAPIMFYAATLIDPTPNTVGGVLGLAVPVIGLATLYGYLSARFLEGPIRRWAHRFGSRAAATPQPDLVKPREPGATLPSG